MRNNLLEREQVLYDAIISLDEVNNQIADLIMQREELTKEIIAAIDHKHEGQKTYEFYKWHVTCKTPMIYSLDKKKYELGEVHIPGNFDPIKQTISYTIDKAKFEEYMTSAPESARDALCELITKKPGKESISLKTRS